MTNSQIRVAVEQALIEAVQDKGRLFTVIGIIDGQLHVPAKGWIL